MAQVLVIGGGLSGLTYAYKLLSEGIDVLVLEASAIPGGCIKTSKDSGHLMEHGPNSMLVNRQGVLDLIQALELPTLEANQEANKRYIVRDHKLLALPSSPLSFARTPLFSFRDKLRLFREPFIGRADHDESIADFVKRRLGPGFYDYAINPFVGGVYAGDPEQLLARAAVKKVYRLEEDHGSLIRGAVAMLTGKDKPEGRIKGRMLSFKDGMATLPKTLAQKLGDRLITNAEVLSLKRTSLGWTAETHDTTYEGAHLCIATPAPIAAQLLKDHDDDASRALLEIPYAPVSVVHLHFKRGQVQHPLDGFGCLIPRKENLHTLGCLFSSTLFSGRSQDSNEILLTCFIGGATKPEIRNWDDQFIIDTVISDAKMLLGIKGTPLRHKLVRWQEAIPQYTFGHFERIAAVDAAQTRLGQLTTRANWRDGISVPDCILNATQSAETFLMNRNAN